MSIMSLKLYARGVLGDSAYRRLYELKQYPKRMLWAVLGTRAHRFYELMLRDSWGYLPVKQYLDYQKLLLFWKVCPYAQQNFASLSNVYDLTILIERNHVPGSIVECGVWRGGCAAVMGVVSANLGSGRKVWLFDSFEGMPEAGPMDIGENAERLATNRMNGRLVPINVNVAQIDGVRRFLFEELVLDPEKVVLVKGWFQDTLPEAKNKLEQIALLRIDGDWYESTKVCLEQLFDTVTAGGYVIIDDYGFFPGCKAAVDEFIKARELKVELKPVDYSRVYFQKP